MSQTKSKKLNASVLEPPKHNDHLWETDNSEDLSTDRVNDLPNDSPSPSSSYNSSKNINGAPIPSPESPGLRSKVETTPIDLSSLIVSTKVKHEQERSKELLDITQPFLEATKGEPI